METIYKILNALRKFFVKTSRVTCFWTVLVGLFVVPQYSLAEGHHVSLADALARVQEEFKDLFQDHTISKINFGQDYDFVEYRGGWQIYLSKNKSDLIGDDYILLVCHELGHIASEPMKGSGRPSTELEADYWATKHCLPRVFASPNFGGMASAVANGISADIEKVCASTAFPSICGRSVKAAYKWRQANYKGLANNHLFYDLKVIVENRDCTPPIGEMLPQNTQCSFNALVAGAIGESLPQCMNQVMFGYPFDSDGRLQWPTIYEDLKCPQ